MNGNSFIIHFLGHLAVVMFKGNPMSNTKTWMGDRHTVNHNLRDKGSRPELFRYGFPSICIYIENTKDLERPLFSEISSCCIMNVNM